MQNFKQFTLDYIEKLYENNNKWLESDVFNRFSREEFYYLLKPAIDIILFNKDLSYIELRNKIIDDSLLNESIIDIINSGITLGIGFCASTENIDLEIYSGFYDLDNQLVCNNTLYDIASVTKLYTSILTLLLTRFNTFNLNDKVTKYAPEFINLKDVTIYDLLTFNVNLVTDGRIDDENISKCEALTKLHNIKIDKNKVLDNPYTDMGYIILKYVLESATGVKFNDLMDYFIINKIGAKNTTFNVLNENIESISSTNHYHYVDCNGNLINKYYDDKILPFDGKARKLYDGSGSGHAGLFATVSDLNLLSQSLINNRLLDTFEIHSLISNATGKKYYTNDQVKYRMYFGKGVYLAHPLNAGEVCAFQSGGAIAGWTGTYVSFDPFNKISLAFAGNKTFGLSRILNNEHLVLNEHNQTGMYDTNGKFLVNSSRFAWDKESIVKDGYILMMRLRFLEEYVKMIEPDYNIKSRLVRHL